MRTPIFDFAIARNVQTISPDVDQPFAIRLAPEIRASTHYLNDLPRMSFARIRVALENRAPQFSDEYTLRGLRLGFDVQLVLHREMHEERHRSTLEHLLAAFEAIAPPPLTDQDQIRLWDNLAHFMWIAPDEDIVETIRAVLVADHFRRIAAPVLRAGDLSDPRQVTVVRRAMRARIVIPIGVDNRVATETPDTLSVIQARMMRAAHREISDRQRIGVLTAFRVEVSTALATLRPATDVPAPSEPRRPTNALAANTLSTAQPTFSLSTAELRPRLAINALGLAPRTDLPLAVADLITPDADADEALRQLDEQLEIMIEQTEDHDTADPQDQQVFFLHGAEISVSERIPPGSFMISTDVVEGGLHLVMSYFHDNAEAPEIARVAGRITGDTTAAQINAEPLPSGKPGYQYFRLTETPLTDARVEISLDLSPFTGDQRASVQDLVLHDVGDISAVAPWAGPDELVANPPPLFGVNKIGVIDFHRVEQELFCFEATEPSRIENLLAREHKERMTRRFTLDEVESEITREVGSERQDENTTTNRFEQQSTVEEVLAEEQSRNINVNAGVSGGFGKSIQVFANTAMTFANASSREESRTDAMTFAQDITSRVAQKITAKTTERRRSRTQTEHEEVTRHGLDNRAGDQHVVGIYRFLDKVYRNRLVNYGRRCVVEWMIPEPARNFIRAQELAVPQDDFTRRPPRKPKRLGMRRPSSVTPENYRRFGKAYGVEDLPPPPPYVMYIARNFAENNPGVTSPSLPPPDGQPFQGPQAVAYDIEIPDEYLATHYKINLHQLDEDDENDMVQYPHPISHMVPVSTIASFPLVMTVKLKLVIRRTVQRDWQYRIFHSVMEAYREKKAEYDAAREAYKEGGLDADLNPRFKKDIIQRELRRIALYMIQKPHGTDVTHDHYKPAAKGALHELKLTAKLDQHANIVRFFEQCFDWDLMAYLLYPYFYSDEKTWDVKLAMEETFSRDFASFLTSGMARLVVPIRPGFEDAVTHYLQTGEVWFGRGLVMDVENDLYLSIAEEMASGSEETEILDTWLTKVPTNLNILQQDAAAVVGNGLPCLDEDEEPIGTGSSTLAPVLNTPAPNE